MKKNMKSIIYWGICAGSIIAGSILFAVGSSMGGSTSFKLNGSGLMFNNDNPFEASIGGFSSAEHLKDTEHYEFPESTLTSETLEDLETTNDKGVSSNINDVVTKVEFEGNFSNVTITTGDTLSFDSNSTKIKHSIKNGTLYIEDNANDGASYPLSAFVKSAQATTIEIIIPTSVTTLDIETSGSVNIAGVILEKMELSSKLGAITLASVDCATLDIDADAGDVRVVDSIIGILDVEVSLGQFIFEDSDITRRADIECDMGNVELDLIGDEANYNFITNVSLGKLEINGDSKNRGNTGNGIPIEIEAELGSVMIETK